MGYFFFRPFCDMITIMKTFTHPFSQSFHRVIPGRCALLAASLMLAIGCATAPKAVVKAREPIYFPPPPETPHAVFLCHLGGELGDIAKPSKNSFLDFLVGKPSTPPQFLVKPFGLVVHDGRLYVADTAKRGVAMVNFSDGKLTWIGGRGRGGLSKPTSVSFGPDGRLYVCDTLRRQVVVFDKDGNYLSEYGDSVSLRPVDARATTNQLFVLDTGECSIKVFDLATGKMVRTIGKKGNGPGEFNRPNAMTMDKEGNIYVCDALNLRVQKIAQDGTSLLVFGKAGQGPGMMARPRGLEVSQEGIIYVTDAMMGTVQLFNQQGQALMHLGYPGFQEGELYLPAQVTFSYEPIPYFNKYVAPGFVTEYLVFVSNNIGGNKVSVFAFGHPTQGTPAPSTPPTP